MPIFEYKCGRCSRVFEEIVLSGDTDKIRCPECGNRKVARLISRTGSLKQSGSSATEAGQASSCGAGKFT